MFNFSLSPKNYIERYKKIIPKNLCQKYIEDFENLEEEKKINHPQKFYEGISLYLPEHEELFNLIILAIQNYVEKNTFLASWQHWQINYECNIQKYLPNQSYNSEHCEHGTEEFHTRRILAWMIYLNDITDKGGTCWPQQKFITKPKKGDLYIWPAGWTHSHYGIASPTQTKYIITGWCSLI